jgi:multidrug resistance protein MdtO
MSFVSQSLGALHAPSTRWLWLAREMAPSDERIKTTVRMVVATVTVVVLSMALQVPMVWLSAFYCVFVIKENRVVTWFTGVLLSVGATIGIAASLFVLRYTFDRPEYRIPAMAAMVFAGMWVSRALTIGTLGYAVGMVLAICQSEASASLTPDEIVREFLWVWVVIVYPVAVAVVVNITILPVDPRTTLERELKRRLELTIATLRGVVASNVVGGRGDAVLVDLASRGSASLEAHLRLAAFKHRSIRARHAALSAAIREMDRLLVAAANLGLRDPVPLTAPDRRAAEDVVAILTRLTRSPLDGHASAEAGASGADPTIPELREMQRASLALRDELGARDPNAPGAGSKKKRRGLFVPDAFSNPNHVRFALKVTLAAMICYVIYNGVDWSGISTSFITCCIVALESTGASIRKARLRIAGCALGGALGFLSIMYLVPHMDSIVSLAFLTAAGTAVAGWIAAGSERVSYAGMQVALAFFMCIDQGFAPKFSFDDIRNRIVGILLGILVSSAVFRSIWPESAADKLRVALVRMLRGLAQLVRIPAVSPDVDQAAGEKLRESLAGDLNGILRLSELTAVEGTEHPAAEVLSPEKARKIAEESQEIYLTASILAGEVGFEEWSRLNAAARSGDLNSRIGASEQLRRTADAVEAGRIPGRPARAATTDVPLSDSGKGERSPLVRRLSEGADRVVALASNAAL